MSEQLSSHHRTNTSTLYPFYIHGKPQGSAQHQKIPTINPSNGEVIAEIYQATYDDLEKAVRSAKEGQKIWASYSAVERSRILMKAVQLLRARNDELAHLETANTGKPLSETLSVDIATGADVIEYYAGLIAGFEGRHIPLRSDSFVYILNEPLGVVAGIGAWNYPIQIAMWKSAPALAAGNAMIFKPSELTSLTTIKLAEIYTEAGVPDGVFNVLTGSGKELGTWLTQHPDIAKISFTGGTSTGKKVMLNATHSNLKQVTMELGGKSPLIVFEDADLDRAVDVALMGNFYSSGQVCTSCTRVFVQRSQYALFKEKLAAKVAQIRLGDPLDPQTNFGPLVSVAHMEQVLRYIQIGIDEGATLLIGGRREVSGAFGKGAYVQPTVFADCHDEMTLVKEEIFGPVMSLLVFDTEDEVILRANSTDYGLAAAVITESLSRAHRVMQRLKAGICWVNTWGESPPQMPVGGYKESGIGRENGWQTLSSYTQTKSIQIELGVYQSVF